MNFPPNKYLLTICMIIVVFSNLRVRAEVIDDQTDKVEQISIYGSRLAASAKASAVMVSDIDNASLQMTSPVHIEEVLKYIAGAAVQRGSGQEYLPALRSEVFTGAGACGGILTSEDDIPLRAAGFCNINELFEAHTEMAGRIEVMKGPGTVLYGSNAMHGVINVVTPDTTYGGGFAGIDIGSYGYSRGKIRQGWDFGHSGFGLNGSFTRDRGYRDEESVDQQKLNLRHRYSLGSYEVSTGFTYTHLDQKTAGYLTGYEKYKDREASQGNDDSGAFRKNRSVRAWSKLTWALDDEANLTLTPYVRDQDMTFLMHFLPGTPIEDNYQSGVGLQSLYSSQLSFHWQWLAGIDAEYTRGGLRQYQEGATEGSPFLMATVPQGLHYDYEVNATQLAPFVSLNYLVGNWQVSSGVRFEYMAYDYSNNMLTGRTREDGSECGFGGCRYARPPNSTDSFSNTSINLGVSYQWSSQLQTYARVSSGFRAPQATEMYRLQREQVIADLQSEKALNVETGVKAHYDNLRYTLSAFVMDKENSIYRDSDFFNLSGGKSRHRGVEAEINYQISEQWDAAVAGTFARHTYEHDEILSGLNINGNDIDTAPRKLLNVRLGWSPGEDVRTELEWQHVGRYFTDPENLHEYSGHDVFHLRASYSVSDELTFYARILNLTDTRYAERADYSSFNGDRYFPGMPRHYQMSMRYQW